MFSLISLSQIGYIYIDKKFPSKQILYIDCIYDSFLLILNTTTTTIIRKKERRKGSISITRSTKGKTFVKRRKERKVRDDEQNTARDFNYAFESRTRLRSHLIRNSSAISCRRREGKRHRKPDGSAAIAGVLASAIYTR